MGAYHLFAVTQKMNNMNYFELMGLEERPYADKARLTKNFIALQRNAHPDKHAGSNEWELADKSMLSAEINKAYAIFKDEHKTLEYFLITKGVIHDDEKYKLPNDFLMEMMNINEVLEEEGVEAYRKRIAVFAEDIESGVLPFLSGEKEVLTQEDLALLSEYYFKKKYLNRLLDRIMD